MSQQRTQSGPSSAVVPAVTNDTVELAVLKNAIELKDEHNAQMLALHTRHNAAVEQKVLGVFQDRISDLKQSANHQHLERMNGGGHQQNMRPPWMEPDSLSQGGQ